MEVVDSVLVEITTMLEVVLEAASAEERAVTDHQVTLAREYLMEDITVGSVRRMAMEELEDSVVLSAEVTVAATEVDLPKATVAVTPVATLERGAIRDLARMAPAKLPLEERITVAAAMEEAATVDPRAEAATVFQRAVTGDNFIRLYHALALYMSCFISERTRHRLKL